MIWIDDWSDGVSKRMMPAYDARGNVVALVAAHSLSLPNPSGGGNVTYNTGDMIAQWEYDPYGNILRQSGAFDRNPFRYQTKWDMDFGSEGTTYYSWGLIDYGLRYYQPENGRFINRDPIGEKGGLNLYEAFGGDPVNNFDYLGQFSIRKKLKKLRNSISKRADPLTRALIKWDQKADDKAFKTVQQNPWMVTVASTAFSMFGMPYIGAAINAAWAAENGASLGRIAISFGVGAVAGYAAGPVAGSISDSLGLAARHLGTSLIRGGLSGGLAGAGMAGIYGGSIGRGFKNGAFTGMLTSAAVHGYRAYQTERFIRSSSIAASSPEARAEMLSAIRDAGQSPIGQRLMRNSMRSGQGVSFFEAAFGDGSKVDMDTNTVYLDVEQLRTYVNPGSVVVHELGHVPAAGFGYDIYHEHLNVRDTENKYRWWTGVPRRPEYVGMLTGFRNMPHPEDIFSYEPIIADTPVPTPPVWQQIVRPGF